MKPRNLSIRSALFACTWLATGLLAGCGGSVEDSTTEAAGIKAAQAFSPIEPTCCTIQPLQVSGLSNATVGRFAGTTFSGSASGGFPPYTYRWLRNGTSLGNTGTTHRISSAVTTDAGTYTFEARDRTGQLATASATLAVVSNAWAALGGRTMFSANSPQQPSIALCNGRSTVAWINTSAAGIGLLAVWQFDGAAWTSLGGAYLNVSTMASAAQPSIDCLDGHGTASHPIVAWVEGSGSATNVNVKYWTGASWQSAGGALNFAQGSKAEKPVLRTNHYNPPTNVTRDPVVTRMTSLAWIENGVPSLRVWNNGGWQAYAGGQGPGGGNARYIALTIDLGRGNAYPPVLAWLQQNTNGVQPYVAIHDGGSWTLLGDPRNGFGDATVAVGGGIGIAVGKLKAFFEPVNNGRVPVAWFESSAGQFMSYYLDTPAYAQLDVGTLWRQYGERFAARSSATAYDPREFGQAEGISCGSVEPPAFGIALTNAGSSANGTQVRRGNCSQIAPAAWPEVRPMLPRAFTQLSLRMASVTDPIVSGAYRQKIAAPYELSTWQFYP